MDKIYIPNKIRVGFVNRNDTYTKRLAYVIPIDNLTGKVRKEVSWERWRDKNIEPEEYENIPTEEFALNKDVQRYNWSYYGSGRSYIRVYDPRGIEFEITPENLITILMHVDCNKRTLMGSFVYGWSGKDLVLLPCDSDAYREAVKHTDLVSKKFSLKDLKEGATYATKSGDSVVYMGRHVWTTWKRSWSDYIQEEKREKKHLFYNLNSSEYEPLESKQLSSCLTEEWPDNYSELLENLEYVPAYAAEKAVFNWEPTEPTFSQEDIYRSYFFVEGGGRVWTIEAYKRSLEDLISRIKNYPEHYPEYKLEDLEKSSAAYQLEVIEVSQVTNNNPDRMYNNTEQLAPLGLSRTLYLYKDPDEFKKQFSRTKVVAPYWELKGQRFYCKRTLSLQETEKSWKKIQALSLSSADEIVTKLNELNK